LSDYNVEETMKIGVWLVTSAAVFLVAAKDVRAVEPLMANELAEHCAADSARAEDLGRRLCIGYIQGFVDGAVATDERVLLNMEAELNQKESLTERAIRTRGLGSSRDRAARYAEICLGDPVSMTEVVSKVVADFTGREFAPDAMACTVVYSSLRKHFPCKPDSTSPRVK
jgi:hypothetical protein